MTLVAVSGAVGYYTFNQPGAPAFTSSTAAGQAVPDAVLAELANVSPSTLNTVGPGAPGVSRDTPGDYTGNVTLSPDKNFAAIISMQDSSFNLACVFLGQHPVAVVPLACIRN